MAGNGGRPADKQPPLHARDYAGTDRSRAQSLLANATVEREERERERERERRERERRPSLNFTRERPAATYPLAFRATLLRPSRERSRNIIADVGTRAVPNFTSFIFGHYAIDDAPDKTMNSTRVECVSFRD